ncbi:MAG: hypothetical protein FJ202_02200 [Gemmatimonadetes bacterium]|nr:hypothetical protein [Gemmatimonadota bacterium]
MTQQDDDLIAGWLRRLPREIDPPPAVADSTIHALRQEGLLRSRWRGTLSVASWALAAGVGAIAFVAGSYSASRFLAPGKPVAAMNAPSGTTATSDTIVGANAAPLATYALMLYGGEEPADSIGEVARSAEYSRWASRDHGPDAAVVGGEALGLAEASIARYATASSGEVEVEEKLGEATQLVGYFLVFARSREAALRLARDCPHLKYGGRVVVRRILQN